jgi:hypothetical protein
MNKTPDTERGNLGAPEVPPIDKTRAVKLGIGAETFAKAAGIAQQIIDQHILALGAFGSILQSMKNAEDACREDNIEEVIKAVVGLPQQYGIVANAGFKQAQLLNEITKLMTDATKALDTSQADYSPGNKSEDLRGYA